MSSQRRTVEAVRFTCGIVEYLRDNGEAGVTDLAREFDRSKSSVHAYLTTLTEEKLLVKNEGRYSLSLLSLDLAEGVKDQIDEYDVIASEVDDLAEKTGEVAQFGVRERDDLVYLHVARGKSAVETRSSIGGREPIHATAPGKAILAEMDESTVRNVLGPESYRGATSDTFTEYDCLFDELAEIRDREYALDAEENIVGGLVSVAVPVVLDDGTVLGAVSVTGPASRFTEERIRDELKKAVTATANVIQINVMYS